MPNYHIEGLSGTGKTTVGEELKKRGHKVIDADEAFAYYADPKTGLPTEEKHQLNWFWDKEKVKEELIQKLGTEARFVCGGSMNQEEFKECFKKAFVLYLNDEQLRERLLNRTNNPFGKEPEDLQRQLDWNQNAEGTLKYAREKGAIPIDASQPLEKVVDEILSHIKENN